MARHNTCGDTNCPCWRQGNLCCGLEVNPMNCPDRKPVPGEVPQHAGTPGPWKAHCVNGIFIIKSDDDRKTHICRLTQVCSDTTVANANLIAAAPDLLTTLEGCMKALSRMIDQHDPDSIEAEWIGHAHEAILQAKGEA